MTCVTEIPVMRPLLPTTDRIVPYLRKIDATRSYSNFGPLSDELEQRFEHELGMDSGSVVCTSSGTTAILAAILARTGSNREKRFAAVPGFTFSATALAVEMAGFEPYIVDVDPASWLLDPQRLLSHVMRDQIGLVVPVATFGKPVQQAGWRHFEEETGIPVVIDGAASFALSSENPSEYFGEIPVALSFHATKSFGVGEGGAVAWSHQHAERLLIEAVNFGFFESRLSRVGGMNGKMSEYHAAVGLAELDCWTDKRELFGGVVEAYRVAARKYGLADRLIAYPDTDFCYPLFYCLTNAELRSVEDHLSAASIRTRLWYGGGLESHPHFSGAKRENLSVSTLLGSRLLGLPMAADMTDPEVGRVCETISACIHNISPDPREKSPLIRTTSNA